MPPRGLLLGLGVVAAGLLIAVLWPPREHCQMTKMPDGPCGRSVSVWVDLCLKSYGRRASVRFPWFTCDATVNGTHQPIWELKLPAAFRPARRWEGHCEFPWQAGSDVTEGCAGVMVDHKTGDTVFRLGERMFDRNRVAVSTTYGPIWGLTIGDNDGYRTGE